MKKLTLFIVFVCFVCNIGAQVKVSSTTSKGWEIGAGLTFGTTLQILSNTNSNRVYVNSNPALLQFSTGVFARKFFKGNYGFEFGAQISTYGIRSWKNEQQFDQSGNSLGFVSFSNRRSYLVGEIPLRFLYKRSIKKIDLGAIVGFSQAFMIVASNTVSSNGGALTSPGINTTNIINDMHLLNVFADIGLLFRVKIYKNLYFETKPLLRISLIPMEKNPANNNKERLLSIGSNFGIAWQFK